MFDVCLNKNTEEYVRTEQSLKTKQWNKKHLSHKKSICRANYALKNSGLTKKLRGKTIFTIGNANARK